MNICSLNQLIRKRYISRLFLPVIVLITGVMLLVINPFESKYKPANITELSQTPELFENQSKYVKITADTLYYSGIDYQINNKVKARIYYTLENDVCYYFIISSGRLPDNYSTLENFSFNAQLIDDNDLLRKINAAISRELDFSISGLKETSCPVIISQYHYTHGFATFYLMALLLICTISAIHIIFILCIIAAPTLSQTVMYLRKYGNRKTLYALACSEFDVSTATACKNVYITDSFLISIARMNVDIIPLENIVWIYNYNVLHKSKGSPKMYFPLCIVTDCKRLYKIHRITQKTSDRIIDVIQSRFPEIMVGYDN